MYFMDWSSSVADSCKLQVPANTIEIGGASMATDEYKAGFEAGILEGLRRSIEKHQAQEVGLIVDNKG